MDFIIDFKPKSDISRKKYLRKIYIRNANIGITLNIDNIFIETIDHLGLTTLVKNGEDKIVSYIEDIAVINFEKQLKNIQHIEYYNYQFSISNSIEIYGNVNINSSNDHNDHYRTVNELTRFTDPDFLINIWKNTDGLNCLRINEMTLSNVQNAITVELEYAGDKSLY